MTATPIDHAQAFVQRGWCPVPVAFRSKIPTDPKTGLAMDDWQKLRIGKAELPEWFSSTEPQNVGISLGEPSGDLVDIDLDCDEAVELGFQFLPRTGAVFGRPGRPRSHWLYRCKTATRRFKDHEGKTLLEIRSTGAQTVGPGSVHDKSGELITWEPGRAEHPAEISEQTLTSVVQRLACAVILARNFPAEGGRHDAMLHLAGGLLRSGFDVDHAGSFIVAVARAGGSADPEHHRAAASDTAEKIRKGDKTTGWPSYAQCCPNGEGVIRKVCEWLGVKPDAETEEPGDPFADRWIRLASAPELLIEKPPKQEWLLTRWQDGREIGVLPRGKTGLLNGTGGTGKTYALMQLALAIASGGFWFGTFQIAKPGHVLLALAEEELDEAQRRLWRAANALELSNEQRRQAAGFIDLLPLHGVPVALTQSSAPGLIVETPAAQFLRERLEERGVDWAAIIMDPLSRWASGGVEKDNEAATRFCQVVERFCGVRGNPSVIVAHHSSKVSAGEGNADSRGVSGIRDGFRWQASLDAVEDSESGTKGIRLRNRKSNYSPEFEEVALARNTEPGVEGTLRLATKEEAERLRAVSGREVSDDEIQRRVMATVAKHTGLTSATKIAELTQGTKGKILAAVKELRSEGRLVLTEGVFMVRLDSSEKGPNQ